MPGFGRSDNIVRYRLKVKSMRQIIAEHELEQYKMLAAQLADERDSLSALLAASEGELNREVVDAISNRLGLLNHFQTAYITNDSKLTAKADEEILRLLKDKEAFIASTRLAFAGTHPHFVKYLEEHGLDEQGDRTLLPIRARAQRQGHRHLC